MLYQIICWNGISNTYPVCESRRLLSQRAPAGREDRDWVGWGTSSRSRCEKQRKRKIVSDLSHLAYKEMYTKCTCVLMSYCRSMIIMIVYHNGRSSSRLRHWFYRHDLCQRNRDGFSIFITFLFDEHLINMEFFANLPLCRAKLTTMQHIHTSFAAERSTRRSISFLARKCRENLSSVYREYRETRVNVTLIVSFNSRLFKNTNVEIVKNLPTNSGLLCFSRSLCDLSAREIPWKSLDVHPSASTAKWKSTQHASLALDAVNDDDRARTRQEMSLGDKRETRARASQRVPKVDA